MHWPFYCVQWIGRVCNYGGLETAKGVKRKTCLLPYSPLSENTNTLIPIEYNKSLNFSQMKVKNASFENISVVSRVNTTAINGKIWL